MIGSLSSSSIPLQLRARAELELRRRARERGIDRDVLLRPQLSELKLNLWLKQKQALESTATELLMGGAAGPGKSHLLRVAAITWAHLIQGLQVYIFRREFPDLMKNHMDGPTSFPMLLASWIDKRYAKINWSDHFIQIGRSKIHLCHCQHDKDVFGYQGAEIHALLPDELTQFTESIYRFLRSRVRMPEEFKASIPEAFRGQFPRVLAGSNPGGIGHNFVKATFIDPKPEGEIWETERSEGGMRRQFIGARLTDNPSLNAEEYSAKLEGLPEYLRKAMLDGDWNIIAGGMFDDLWNSQTERFHVLPSTLLTAADIPKTWMIDRAMDWGSSHPFAIGWWAESDGTQLTLRDGTRRSWPRGTLIKILELYGWNGKANEGCRKGPAQVAKEILQVETDAGIKGRVCSGPADPSIFDVEDGESIGQKFANAGIRWEEADKSPGSRKNGAEDIRERLRANMEKPREHPGLIFLDACRHSLRLFPSLPRDLKKPDDINTKAEDHDYDMTRYRCMFKRQISGSGEMPY